MQIFVFIKIISISIIIFLHFPNLHAGCFHSRPNVEGESAIPSPSHNIIHQSRPSPPPSHPQENVTAVASSSSSQHVFDENRCKCQRHMKNRMFVKEKYDGIELKFIRDDDIGSGGYGRILHAYWERENEAECVALKDILMYSDERIKFALNEVNVLNEVMEFPDEQRDHIITMHGSEEKTIGGNRHMYIILELGGIDLEVYYNKMRRNKDLVLLNILKCAARGLQQFHEIGIHLDIKAKNFVIPLDQDLNSPLKSCKLIDFSFSIITQQEPVEIELYGTNKYAPPEFINTKLATRKNDIFAFGVMTYKFLKAPNADNFSVNKRLLGNSRLDRVAKVCMEKEADNRPSIKALNDFLNGNCDRFISEQNEYGKLCEN